MSRFAKKRDIAFIYIDDAGSLPPVLSRYDMETGEVVCTVKNFSKYAIGCHVVAFRHISESAWYYKAVTYCAAHEMAAGTGNSMFSPDAALIRGQFATLLMQAYGFAPEENAAHNFADTGSTYDTGYLAAAKGLDITSGVRGNLFLPDQVITRQDRCTLLYRALDVLGKQPEADGDVSMADFGDADRISAYAMDAVKQFAAMGIVSGSNGNLNPPGAATRAQMAQILYNLLSK